MQFQKKMMTAFFLMLTALMLTYSRESLYYALTGLNLWFQKMIPTLLPFMILSGIMVRMKLTEGFAGLFYPLLKPLFKVSRNGAYCMIMGFLCGFPMGARVITELYERNRLEKAEAEYLLAFCNNIGPIYFVSFVLPTIGITQKKGWCILGMYGLPLLYGFFLRHTKYRGMVFTASGTDAVRASEASSSLTANTDFRPCLLYHIDDAINAGIAGITSLGGYMVLFNLLNLIPHAIFQRWMPGTDSAILLALLNGLLEITSGISRMGSRFPAIVLLLLPLGGLSCVAQTYSIIRHTDLSLRFYLRHKGMLSAITFLYYVLLHVSGTFSFAFWTALFS